MFIFIVVFYGIFRFARVFDIGAQSRELIGDSAPGIFRNRNNARNGFCIAFTGKCPVSRNERITYFILRTGRDIIESAVSDGCGAGWDCFGNI